MRKFEFVKRYNETRKLINEDRTINEWKLPQRSTAKSAGYDFMAIEDTFVSSESVTYVRTGVKAYMSDDEFLMLCNRSSNPKKKELVLINGIGIIDSDYADNPDNDGEIAFAFKSLNPTGTFIKAGEKLGQRNILQIWKN